MDPSRYPGPFSYNPHISQYNYNTVPVQNYSNYGWPNYSNFISPYPIIPLLSYPNQQIYNHTFDPNLVVPIRLQQPTILVPPPRYSHPQNAVFGPPPLLQTSTRVKSNTEAVTAGITQCEDTNQSRISKLYQRNIKQRKSNAGLIVTKGRNKSLLSNEINDNRSVSNVVNLPTVLSTLLENKTTFGSTKLDQSNLKRPSRKKLSSKRNRSRLHRMFDKTQNSTDVTTELSAIANDGTHGRYKAIRVTVSDNGDPNDSNFETCEESDSDEIFNPEESNWNVNETTPKKDFNGNCIDNTALRKLSESLDYTVIRNDKSYSEINFDPDAAKTFKPKRYLLKEYRSNNTEDNLRLQIIHESKHSNASNRSSLPASLERNRTGLLQESDWNIKTHSPFEIKKQKAEQQFGRWNCYNSRNPSTSRNQEVKSTLKVNKTRSPDLWWDRSTDLGYDVVLKNKSPFGSLNEPIEKDLKKVDNSNKTPKTVTKGNDNFDLAKNNDYEIIEFFDFQQKSDDAKTLPHKTDESGSTITNTRSKIEKTERQESHIATLCGTMITEASYKVPDNTPVNLDYSCNDSYQNMANQTAPDLRTQRKKLEVDWKAIHDIVQNLPQNKTPQSLTEKRNFCGVKKTVPSISGQDSAILAYGKSSKLVEEDLRVDHNTMIAINDQMLKQNEIDLVPTTSLPSTDFSNTKSNWEIKTSLKENYAQNMPTKKQSKHFSSKSISEKSSTNEAYLERKPVTRNDTYLVMHKTLTGTPMKNQNNLSQVKKINSVSKSFFATNTPKFKPSKKRRPSTCSKGKTVTKKLSHSSFMSRSTSEPNLTKPTELSVARNFENYDVDRGSIVFQDKEEIHETMNEINVSSVDKKRQLFKENKKSGCLEQNESLLSISTDSKKKFEMIRNLFNSEKTPTKTLKPVSSNRRSLPASFCKRTDDNIIGSKPSKKLSPHMTKTPSTSHLLSRDNSLIKRSLKSTVSVLNLTQPSKNKALYNQAKPPNTPYSLSLNRNKASNFGHRSCGYPQSKSAPSTPIGILKRSQFKAYPIMVDDEKNEQVTSGTGTLSPSSECNTYFDNTVAKRAEIVTVDDVAESLAGNEGDDEASSISTKNSEHVDEAPQQVKEVSPTINPQDQNQETKTSGLNILETPQQTTAHQNVKPFINYKKDLLQSKEKKSSEIHSMESPQNENSLSFEVISENGNSLESKKESKNPSKVSEGINGSKKEISLSLAPSCLGNNFNKSPKKCFESQTGISCFQSKKIPVKPQNNSIKSNEKINTSNFSLVNSLSIDGDSGLSIVNHSSEHQIMPVPIPPFSFVSPTFQTGLNYRINSSLIHSSNKMVVFPHFPSQRKDVMHHAVAQKFFQPVISSPGRTFVSDSKANSSKGGKKVVKVQSGFELIPYFACKPVTKVFSRNLQHPVISTKRLKHSHSASKLGRKNRTFSVPNNFTPYIRQNSSLQRRYIKVYKDLVNFSHPPLYVFNTSLEHPSVSALRVRERSKPPKPIRFRKRLEAVQSLTPDEINRMMIVKKVITSPSLSVRKLRQLPKKIASNSGFNNNSICYESQCPRRNSTSSVNSTVSFKSTQTDKQESAHNLHQSENKTSFTKPNTSSGSVKSKGRKWAPTFINRLMSSSKEKSNQIGKKKTFKKNLSKSKRRKVSGISKSQINIPTSSSKSSVSPGKTASKDYCEVNRALYKASFLCMAPIESKASEASIDSENVTSASDLAVTQEDVFEETGQQSRNVVDYFGRDLTSSNATIKYRSVRQSVGSTPGVRINSETGDVLDHAESRKLGSVLCSTTIGDSIIEEDRNAEIKQPKFYGTNSFQSQNQSTGKYRTFRGAALYRNNLSEGVRRVLDSTQDRSTEI